MASIALYDILDTLPLNLLSPACVLHIGLEARQESAASLVGDSICKFRYLAVCLTNLVPIYLGPGGVLLGLSQMTGTLDEDIYHLHLLV